MADQEIKEKPGSSVDVAPNGFEQQAAETPPGVIAEFWDFLINNKAWWITPIVLVLLLFGLILVLGGTVASPFIYTIF